MQRFTTHDSSTILWFYASIFNYSRNKIKPSKFELVLLFDVRNIYIIKLAPSTMQFSEGSPAVKKLFQLFDRFVINLTQGVDANNNTQDCIKNTVYPKKLEFA